MSKDTKTLMLILAAAVGIVLAAFLVYVHPADAHEQLYPHIHPHSHVSISEDALAVGAWLLLVAGQLVLAWRLGRKDRRVK